MKNRISSNTRKWLALVVAVLLYYVVHEGSHLIVALDYGVFEEIKMLGVGVQVVATTEIMTELQIAIFCIVGSISTLLVAYLLLICTKKIIMNNNKMFKAICYYTTLAFMLLDPVYLSILYKIFGGGDMNGILLFGIPEIVIQIIYGSIAVVNIFLILNKVYPAYKRSFNE